MSIRPISSRDNPHYKQLRQLATSSQARRKQGKTLLDGVHLCEAWLQHKGMPALCVVSDSSRGNPEVEKIIDACASSSAICLQFPDALFAPLSQVEHGIGLLFVVDTPDTVLPGPLRASAVLLDGLQDPGNLGSILRTAAAAGVREVYCSSGTVFAWSPKVLRAGMGAHFVLNIAENVDLHALISSATVPVLATSSHAGTSLYDADLTADCAWLFGHEEQGVSEPLLALATRQLSIPQKTTIESMNVAASVAVCLFEQLRQQQKQQ